ncbi:MAG: hypothetical protein K9M08_04085 [Pirellula sp.]|nr:hypothetical protein [Pirellula sp.]
MNSGWGPKLSDYQAAWSILVLTSNLELLNEPAGDSPGFRQRFAFY